MILMIETCSSCRTVVSDSATPSDHRTPTQLKKFKFDLGEHEIFSMAEE
jgi:hypothetical protein